MTRHHDLEASISRPRDYRSPYTKRNQSVRASRRLRDNTKLRKNWRNGSTTGELRSNESERLTEGHLTGPISLPDVLSLGDDRWPPLGPLVSSRLRLESGNLPASYATLTVSTLATISLALDRRSIIWAAAHVAGARA